MLHSEIKRIVQGDLLYDVKDQLKRFVYERSGKAFEAGDKARDAIRSIEDIEKRKAFIREKYIEAIGGLPDAREPLNARITGTTQMNGYRIEKVIFESRPKVYVTANLYIPDGIKGPTGAVLFLCGHSAEGKAGVNYQVACQYLVKAGLVVLAQDPYGQGERYCYYEKKAGASALKWSTNEHRYAGNQCWPLNDSSARYFTHDAIRGLDYLCTRPEVDPERIGVTGNSGGGTQTCMLIMCDSRVAAAAPGTFISNRKEIFFSGSCQDDEQNWIGMSAAGLDHEDFLLSMASKPLLVMAVQYDYFPIEGTRQSFERIKRFWRMYGKEDCLELFEDTSTHGFTRPMARKAAEFFSRHLLGGCGSLDESGIKAMNRNELWCTVSGQVSVDFSDTRFIFDENLERLKEVNTKRLSQPREEQKRKALEWLRARVFQNRIPCDVNLRLYFSDILDQFLINGCLWWSQEGVMNHGILFRDSRDAGLKLPVTVAVWDGGTEAIERHFEWIYETCSKHRAVLVLDVSGVGPLLPFPVRGREPLGLSGIIERLAYGLLWLDDDLAAIRTYDVTRAVDMIAGFKELDSEDIRFYAHGRQGVYALLGCFLDKRVKGIEEKEGMKSYTNWIASRYYYNHDIISVVLHGMLHYFDLPELRKWLEEGGLIT